MKFLRRPVALALLSGAIVTGVATAATNSPITTQMTAVTTSLATPAASDVVQNSLNQLTSDSWESLPIASGCAKLIVSCAFGSGSNVVVLYGDSHALMWAPAVVPALLAKKFKVVIYWMPGCPPGHIAVDTQVCTDAWRKSVEDAVTKAKVKPKAVILAERSTDLTLATGGTVTAGALTSGLVDAIRVLNSKGTKVIVLGDNPVMMFGSNYSRSFSPAGCVSAHLNDLRTCDTSLTTSLTYTLSGAEKAAATATKATFIDTTPWLCSTTSKLCPVVLGSRVAYRDAFHLSWTYAASLQNVVSAALAAPLGCK